MPKKKFDMEMLKEHILPLLKEIMRTRAGKQELLGTYVEFKKSLNSLEKQLESMSDSVAAILSHDKVRIKTADLTLLAERLSEGKEQLVTAYNAMIFCINESGQIDRTTGVSCFTEHKKSLDSYIKDCTVALDCLNLVINELDDEQTDFGFIGLQGWHNQRLGLTQLPRAPSSAPASASVPSIPGKRPFSAPSSTTTSSRSSPAPSRAPSSTTSSRSSPAPSRAPSSTASSRSSPAPSRAPSSTASSRSSPVSSRTLSSTASSSLSLRVRTTPKSTASSSPSSVARTSSTSTSIIPLEARATPSSRPSGQKNTHSVMVQFSEDISPERTKNDSPRQKKRAEIIADLDSRFNALDDEISTTPKDLGSLVSRKMKLAVLIARYREQEPEGECSPEVSESSCCSSDLEDLLKPFDMNVEGEQDIVSDIKQQITQRRALCEAAFKENNTQTITEQKDGSINLDSFFDVFLTQTAELRSSLNQLQAEGAINPAQKQELTHLVSQHESCLLMQLSDFYKELAAGSVNVSDAQKPGA